MKLQCRPDPGNRGHGLRLSGAAAGLGLLIWAGLAAGPAPAKAHKLTTVSVRKMADSLHAVIAADRQAYVELATRAWAAEGKPGETGPGRAQDGPPVHARLLRQAAQRIQQGGAEFSYALRSLWPINPAHGPQTEVEQVGLAAVAKHPAEPFYTEEELGGRSYFTAIYADRATLPQCVACHNRHPASPKRDFQVGEVMGAIVVRVPLEF